MFEPSAVPTAKSSCPFIEAATETIISGNDVPMLTTVIPMMMGNAEGAA